MADDDVTAPAAASSASSAPAAMAGPTHAAELKVNLPFGILAFAFAIASLATCYAGILVAYLLGVEPLSINYHVQAVLMWGFALLAVYALWRDRRHHHNNLPLALAAVAAAVLVTTLYVRYAIEFEIIAYVLLVIAAVLNQNFFLTRLNTTVRQQASEIEALNQNLERKGRASGP